MTGRINIFGNLNTQNYTSVNPDKHDAIFKNDGTARFLALYNLDGTLDTVSIEVRKLRYQGQINPTYYVSLTDPMADFDSITDCFLALKYDSEEKTIIIDDAQYLMANEAMNRSKEQGYQKWSEIANHFYQLLLLIRQLPEDVIVYLLAHTETDANGKERFKTVGKLMDSYSIEGVCTICLKTMVDDGYYFTTQNNGYDTVKSPMGLFQTEKIDNDLKAVDTAIRDYYNIPIKSTKKTNKKEG